jgi:hypothetical protein
MAKSGGPISLHGDMVEIFCGVLFCNRQRDDAAVQTAVTRLMICEF